MSTAKYYTYRNLHTGGFSTKHRGKVVHRFDSAYISGMVKFQVSDAGNSRARNEKQRNVHAYIVSHEAPNMVNAQDMTKYVKGLQKISYNPFKDKSFMVDSKPVKSASACYLFDGKCYI